MVGDIALAHGRRQSVRGVEECPTIRKWIVRIGDADVVDAAHDPVVHRASSVYTVLEEQLRVARAEGIVDPIVAASRAIGDIGPAFGVRMIDAHAGVHNHALIVFQHIDPALPYQAIEQRQAPVLGPRVGQAQVSSGEVRRLPFSRIVACEPALAVGSENVEDGLSIPGIGPDASLRPTDPQAELQPLRMRIGRNRGQTLWELPLIGTPISHSPKPAGVDVEHLKTELRRFVDHLSGQRVVDRHPAPPGVVGEQRIAGIADRRSQVRCHPLPQSIRTVVHIALIAAHKHGWRLKRLAWRQPGAKRTGSSGFRQKTEIRPDPCPRRRSSNPSRKRKADTP
jgi:hypothetical protein